MPASVGNLAFPLLLVGGLFLLSRRGGGAGGPGGFGGGNNPMQMGKSKAKFQMEPNTGITFGDVAGVKEAKEDFEEVRWERSREALRQGSVRTCSLARTTIKGGGGPRWGRLLKAWDYALFSFPAGLGHCCSPAYPLMFTSLSATGRGVPEATRAIHSCGGQDPQGRAAGGPARYG